EVQLEDAQVETLVSLKKESEVSAWKAQNEHHKIFKPYFEKRDEELKAIPQFWPIVFRNHSFLSVSTAAPGDADALKALESISVQRNEKDSREFSITFNFAENEFFSNKSFTKAYSVVGDKKDTPTADDIINFDPERDLTTTKVEIDWKSEEKNLVKKHPRTLDPDNEDVDAAGDPGSFFNFIAEEKDVLDIGPIIAEEVYPNAIDVFMGLEDGVMEDSDEEEDDEEDPNAEIDLEVGTRKEEATVRSPTMFCAISGEPPQEAVVSVKSGHLFEKRLIEKYINENGKDPISGEQLAVDDLVSVKSEPKNVAPRPPSLTSVPTLLSTLQSEWDSLVLETHSLREQYVNGRKDLAHALYQVDAAHRVIARLMVERDQAREALSNIQAGLGVAPAAEAAPANGGDVEMQEEEAASGLPADVVSNIDSVAAVLTAERKKRKVPEGAASKDTVKAFNAKDNLASFHSASPAGVNATALSNDNNLLITGGNDKHVQIYDRQEQKTIATLKGHTKKINALEWREKEGLKTLVVSAGDKRVRVYSKEEKGWKMTGEFKNRTGGEVTGMKVHPTKNYAISVGTNQSWSLHNLDTLETLLDVSPPDGESGDFEYQSVDIHPDGVIFATGTQSGICRIWDLKTSKIAANFESPNSHGPIVSLSFSENGYYLAAAFAGSSTIEIFDLRKLKSIHTIQLEEGVSSATTVRFDPSAQFLAIAGSDVRILANKTWEELVRFEDNASTVETLSWGLGGNELIASGLDRTIRALDGKVYDVTDFLPEHPGGSKIILKYGGKDATAEYDPIHPPDAISENLPPEKHLGRIDPMTVQDRIKETSQEEKESAARHAKKPPLGECLSLHDLEAVAKYVLTGKAWMYYSSGADDEITMRENHNVYHRIWFRPRILRDVANVRFDTSILGHKTSMPFYITATALGKLGDPVNGELNLTRSAAKNGIIQMIPTISSCSFDEMIDAALEDQVQFLQLYVNSNREVTEKFVKRAESRGVKGLFVTVDAPQLGRREKDMRMKFEDVGIARTISTLIDPSLQWSDLDWLSSITKMPIVLKGVQSWQDAVIAAERGCAGIVLSNHGGRQLDMAPSGLEILPEVVEALKARGLYNPSKFEIYIDGGVRRASDILKAVALGAKAVGIGRPFIYAYSAYGEDGSAVFLTSSVCMRLLGARSLEEVTPEMVNTANLNALAVPKGVFFILLICLINR
ncbi:WD40 repeat-like protein, partial [Wallemia mellicola]